MKKIMAVLIAGTLIIGTTVAQTNTTPATKSAGKKETVAPQKKDATGTQKPERKKMHHKGGKMKAKKVEAVPQSK